MQYLLRRKVFEFEAGEVASPRHCSAGVHSIYLNKEDAEKAKLELEKARILNGINTRYSQIEYNPDIYTKVAEFFEEKFNMTIWDGKEKNQILPFVKFPKNHTDEDDIKELMEIIGIDFFEIVERENNLVFYRPELNTDFLDKYLSKDIVNELSWVIFHSEYENGYIMFNTVEEAYNSGLLYFVQNIKNNKYRLSISNQPQNLEKLIKMANNCKVDFENNKLLISPNKKSELISIVNDLELIQIEECELWDAMYSWLEEKEEEIENEFKYDNATLEGVASIFSIPSSLMQMKLNGELE